MAFNYKKCLVIVVCLAALLVLAGSALGQSKPSGDIGSVSGPGPASLNKDAGGSCSSYMSVTYDSHINATIGFAGDNDYYRFYFSGGYLRAYTTGSTDTYGYLYTSSCTLVAYNDEGGSVNNFRIYTYRSSGYYYVRVHEYTNSHTGSYTLYLGNGATSYTEGGTGGGTGAGTDAGSSCSSYMSVTYDSRIYGTIGFAGDNDYYRFYFSGGALVAYTEGTTDTYGYLYTSSCASVTYNDDSGTGFNFRINVIRDSGYYYIRVRHHSSSHTGSYTLYLGSGASSYTEGGGSGSTSGDAGSYCSSSMSVTYNSRIYGTIGWAGDNDCYRFYFSGGYLLAYTTGGIDTYGYLYDDSCALVTSNDDAGSVNNFRIYTYRRSGYYYVRVRHHSSSGTGSYTLYLGNGSSSYTEGGTSSGGTGGSDAGSSCSSGMSVTYNSNVHGSIGYLGDVDYYRFYFSGGYLLAYTTGSTDTIGFLYNSSCDYLTYDNNSGTGYNFRIYTYRSSGYYYVQVNEFGNDSTGSYTLYLGNGAASYTEGGTSSGGTATGTSCANASYISVGGGYSGSVAYSGENDYYRIYVSRSGYLTIYTTGTTDTYGYLLDSSCATITYNDDAGSGLNFRIYRYVSPGTYYIRVRGFSTRTGPYTLYTSLS